jgi:coenzyme F420-0:L-glutamate ligase / coenzyme F420-1:gamma-L-glutamate ligase
MTGEIRVIPVTGMPEVVPGDSLADLILDHVTVESGDVVVVTSKIVSKSEGRLVDVDHSDPAARGALIEQESRRILRRREDLYITETRHGFICANSGVDFSNVVDGAALLPANPDRSARRIRDALEARTGLTLAVVVSDTFGRTWRRGLVDVALGCAGITAILDLRGTVDTQGRPLEVTEVAVVDEVAAAADLVMGKAEDVPVAIVRGVDRGWFREGSVRQEIVRPPGEDLFR